MPPSPGAFTTLTTTDTSADSVHVGGAVGGSTFTGGIKAGTIDISGTMVTAGKITIASNVPADTTNALYNSGGNLFFNGAGLATGGSVSGTLNTIAVFTGATSVGNSIMTQSGTTITVATTLNATTLGGTLSTASQPNITGVGTLTAGTWNATIIGTSFGGLGISLAATGGSNMVLRQNSVGGAVTVGTLAVSNLSDGSNVALLNAVNTFTAFGAHTWSAGGAGSNVMTLANPTSGTANFARFNVNAGTTSGSLSAISQGATFGGYNGASTLTLLSPNAGGISIATDHGSGEIRFYTGAGVLAGTFGVTQGFTLTSGTGNIGWGTYTPTLTNGANVTSSAAFSCQYLRVGNSVTVSGEVDVTATAAAAWELGVSLPIASNLAAVGECAGTLARQGLNITGYVLGDAANNRASMAATPSSSGFAPYFFTFTYRVI